MAAEAQIAWTDLLLSPKHADELKASAISPTVALARGYWTAKTKADVKKLGFGEAQLLPPGIILPMFNIAGELCGYQFKPDSPRSIAHGNKSKIVKYENPKGSTTSLDVPKPARKWVLNPELPLIITEGIKKADAAATAEFAVICIIGVWNWRSDDALAALDQIPGLKSGRTVYLAFDSDWRRKRDVRYALRRLANVLRSRGAVVLMIDLPEPTPGIKVGLDDFFAAGHDQTALFQHATEIEEAERDDEDDEPAAPVTVLEALPGAPCGPDAMIPEGWLLSATEVRALKVTTAETLVFPTPVIVTERLVDRSTGDESLKLAFRDQGRWRHITVPRDIAATASKITTLAKSGLPVTSNTAAESIRWISDYLAVNAAALPVISTSSTLGWQDEAGFLLPDRLLTTDGPSSTIIFSAPDSGSLALANSLRPKGTLAGWLAALQPVGDFERVRFPLLACFAAPLLEVLDVPGFVVDLSGPTSGGKTTAERIAGSAWGQSDPGQPSSILSTFQSTRVFKERSSALLNSIPVIIDDTMMAKNPGEVQSFVYDLPGGQGRGRGSITGVQRTQNWRTIALISGENSATGMTDAGGSKARVLTIYGRPFGVDPNAHRIISEVLAGVANNHGHAGPLFVEWLLANKASWPEWRRLHHDRSREIGERAGGGPVVGRVAGYIATVEIASVLAEWAGVLPWPHADISEMLLHELAGEARGADVAAEALLEVLSWASGRAEFFFSSTASEFDPPSGGWLGRWDREMEGAWSTIGFTSDNLRKALEANGHSDMKGIARQWNERGWLEVGKGDDRSRLMKQARLSSRTPTWLYVIKREAEDAARTALNGSRPANP